MPGGRGSVTFAANGPVGYHPRAVRLLTLSSLLAVVCACGPAAAPRQPTVAAPPGQWIDHGGARVYYYDPAAPLVAYNPNDVGPYAVTLVAGTPPSRLEAVVAAGAIAAGPTHLEDDSYVYRIPAAALAAVRAVDGVAAVAPLAPERRYDPARFTGIDPVDVIVDLFADTGEAGRAGVIELVRGWGAELTPVAPHTLRGTVAPSLLPALARISDVRWIEPR